MFRLGFAEYRTFFNTGFRYCENFNTGITGNTGIWDFAKYLEFLLGLQSRRRQQLQQVKEQSISWWGMKVWVLDLLDNKYLSDKLLCLFYVDFISCPF